MRIIAARKPLLLPQTCGLLRYIAHGRPEVSATGVSQLSLARWKNSSMSQSRGAKTKTAVKLKELTQGIIQTDCVPLPEEDEDPVYPTVVQGVKNNMVKFQNCVVLTRVGNFYEVGATFHKVL